MVTNLFDRVKRPKIGEESDEQCLFEGSDEAKFGVRRKVSPTTSISSSTSIHPNTKWRKQKYCDGHTPTVSTTMRSFQKKLFFLHTTQKKRRQKRQERKLFEERKHVATHSSSMARRGVCGHMATDHRLFDMHSF